MAAIIRVKRRRNEDPADTILVSCKKRKEDESNTSENKGLFKFAGTLNSQHEQVSKQVCAAIRKEKLEKEYKRHDIDISTRNTVKKSSEHSRYCIKSQRRALNIQSLDDAETLDSDDKQIGPNSTVNRGSGASSSPSGKVFYFYDVEPESKEKGARQKTKPVKEIKPEIPAEDIITCNSVPMIKEKVIPTSTQDSEYAYDLYYLNSADFDFKTLENILSIEAYREDLMQEAYRDGNDEVHDDEDDSNDEGNWRNDYPEEDPHFYEVGDGYEDDEDGCTDTMGFDPENLEIVERMYSDLHIGKSHTAHQFSDSGEEADEELEAMQMRNACLAPEDLWTPIPRTSYESYKKRVTKELGGLVDSAMPYSSEPVDPSPGTSTGS